MCHPEYRPKIEGELYFNGLNGAASSVCDALRCAGFDAEIRSSVTLEKQFEIETAIDNLIHSVAYDVYVGLKGVPEQSYFPKAKEVPETARKQLMAAINGQLRLRVCVSCELSDVSYVSSDSEDEDIIANFGADVSKVLPEENFELQEITINRDC